MWRGSCGAATTDPYRHAFQHVRCGNRDMDKARGKSRNPDPSFNGHAKHKLSRCANTL